MKKIISILLAVTLVVGMLPATVFAADPVNVILTANKDQVAPGEEIELTLSIDQSIENAYLWQWNILWNSELFDVVSMTKGTAWKKAAVNATATVNVPEPYKASSVTSGNSLELHELAAGTMCTLVLRAKEEITNATAKFYAKCDRIETGIENEETWEIEASEFTNIATLYDWGSDYSVIPSETAENLSISIQKTEPAKTGYEVYYELVGNDTDTEDTKDGFIEYSFNEETQEWNNTVTAEVYIVSYDNDVTLQAYDIYVSHNSKLTYVDNNLVSGVAYFDEDGNLTHIQAVGEDGETEDPIAVPLIKGVPYMLGTITFTIDTANAAHDEELELSLEIGKDSEDITNIAVAEDKGSYYPEDGTTVEGVEINQTWTITWENEDGTVLASGTWNHGDTPVYDGETPTKADDEANTYTHDGWTPAVGKATADATYTATYTATANTYTVTFDLGDHGTDFTQSVVYGSKVIKPEDPTAEHYDFKGWYADSSFNTAFDFDNTEIIGNTTIYAKWEAKTYTITFHPNGAAGNTYTQEIPYGTTAPLTENTFVAPEGQFFLNWATETDGSGDTYGDKAEITLTSDIILYAQWSNASYTVISKTEGVTVDKSAADFEETVTVTVTIPAGYALTGISATNDITGEAVALTKTADGVYTFTMPASNVELVVIPTFEKLDLDVVIDENIENGTVTDPGTAQVEDTVKLESSPTEGYVVDEYTVTYEKGGQTIEVPVNDDGTFTMPGYPVTVTATFRKIQFTVQFNANDGTDTPATATQAFEHGVAQNLTANGFTAPTGKVFVGWALTIDGAVDYEDKAEFSSTTAKDGDVVVLYAIWEDATYTVTLVVNGGTIEADGWTKGEDGNYTGTYTYGTGATLPTEDNLTKDNFTFAGWYTEADFKNEVTEIGAQETGDKTFYAKWDVDFVSEVEEYAYALDGYVMVRIAASSNAKAYTLAGFETYYTNDAAYTLTVNEEAVPVFVTLIPVSIEMDGEETVLAEKVGNEWKLTEYAITHWVESDAAVIEIARDGDVNGDDVVNIADANIVYQMLTEKGPGYYTTLSTLDRLEADVYTADTAGKRGTLDDVNWIVNLINGVSNTESTN